MDSSVLIYFSASISLVFLLIGGVVGWIWSDKTNQFLYEHRWCTVTAINYLAVQDSNVSMEALAT